MFDFADRSPGYQYGRVKPLWRIKIAMACLWAAQTFTNGPLSSSSAILKPANPQKRRKKSEKKCMAAFPFEICIRQNWIGQLLLNQPINQRVKILRRREKFYHLLTRKVFLTVAEMSPPPPHHTHKIFLFYTVNKKCLTFHSNTLVGTIEKRHLLMLFSNLNSLLSGIFSRALLIVNTLNL